MQDFVYLEYVKYQLDLRKDMPVSRNAMYATRYTVVLYKGMTKLFLYQNKLYMFPVIKIAFFYIESRTIVPKLETFNVYLQNFRFCDN